MEELSTRQITARLRYDHLLYNKHLSDAGFADEIGMMQWIGLMLLQETCEQAN